MSIATDLQSLHDNLQNVLTDCNTALTEKGGAEAETLSDVGRAIAALPASSGDLPTLENPAAESDVLEGKEYIDQSGQKKVGIWGVTLPEGIAEYEVQTFTPEVDTNEELAFSLNMQETPTHIMIATDMQTPVFRSFVEYFGGMQTDDSSGDGTKVLSGYAKYAMSTSFATAITASDSSNANRTGVYNLSNTGFTFRGAYYGGQFTYFKAGHTYTIIAMRVKTL